MFSIRGIFSRAIRLSASFIVPIGDVKKTYQRQKRIDEKRLGIIFLYKNP